jgi:dihydroflavonol-4-reductase
VDVLVTGATGLIGSNIAAQLVARGDRVSALVRPGSDAGPLDQLGVRIARGDVRSAEEVSAAVEGSDVVIHSAAVLGGAAQSPDEHWKVNVEGTHNVYEAADRCGVRRVVALSTTTFFDIREDPLSETSPIDPSPPTDPYSVSKLAAFREAMARAQGGQDICVVISGGAYGPSPLPDRSMVAPSFNDRIRTVLAGQMTDNVEFPIPWVYSEDVAAVTVAAADRGRAGERYLGFGQPADVGSIPFFCNRAAEIAGSPHRVRAVPVEDLEDPEVAARFGPSLVALARRRFPEPWFVNDLTRDRLGYRPISLAEGLTRTIEWMEKEGLLRSVTGGRD